MKEKYTANRVMGTFILIVAIILVILVYDSYELYKTDMRLADKWNGVYDKFSVGTSYEVYITGQDLNFSRQFVGRFKVLESDLSGRFVWVSDIADGSKSQFDIYTLLTTEGVTVKLFGEDGKFIEELTY